jgi:hypothetical protein
MVGCSGAFQRDKWLEPQPVWSGHRFSWGTPVTPASDMHVDAKMADTYGFVRVDVEGIKRMNFKFISVNSGSAYNDTFSIVR